MAYTRMPVSGKLQETNFNHALRCYAAILREDAHTDYRRRIDHRQILECGDLALTHHAAPTNGGVSR
jgi:hypothetical protein